MERMEFLDLWTPKNGTRSGFGPGFGYASPMLVHEFLCYNSKFCVIFLKIRPVKEGEPVMDCAWFAQSMDIDKREDGNFRP